MRSRFNFIATAVIAVTMLFGCEACKPRHLTSPKSDTVKVDSSFADTVGNSYSATADLMELSREHNLLLDKFQLTKDSLNFIKAKFVALNNFKDSVVKVNVTYKENLSIAEYKLLRIREYNRIAAQGNNIKFLRGWIIRTLNH